jgi:hypothetical protein
MWNPDLSQLRGRGGPTKLARKPLGNPRQALEARGLDVLVRAKSKEEKSLHDGSPHSVGTTFSGDCFADTGITSQESFSYETSSMEWD